MSEHGRLREMLGKLCVSQNFAVLATQADTQPYCNFISISVSEDLAHILFVTPKHTRKYQNLKKNNNVSILMDNRSNTDSDFKDTVVATAIGCAVELTGDEDMSFRNRHIENHPLIEDFIRSPDCSLFRVDVQKYILVNSFEKVSVLEMHR